MWSNKLREIQNSSKYPAPEDLEPLPEPQAAQSVPPLNPAPDTSFRDLFTHGVNVTKVVNEVLFAHPFLVLRHQCQVRNRSKILHLQPFSLVPIIQTYVSRQGVLSLWKGLSGMITVRVIRATSENALSEFLSLPRDITIYSSPSKVLLNVLLQMLSWTIATPFYAASMVEFVQSEIASEPTTLISCLLEGLRRLLPKFPSTGPRMGFVGGKLKADLRTIPIRTSRLLPVWRLVLPVVVLGVGQHVIRSFVNFGVCAYLRQGRESEELDAETTESYNPTRGVNGGDQALLTSHRRETLLQSTYTLFSTDLTADLIAALAADVILYPLQTIVVRLCVQGTRTLVDNLDTGDSVIPIISSFYGAFDVLRNASSSASGFIGLYRGFGALILQYAVQAAFLVGIKYAYERLLYYQGASTTALPAPPSLTRISTAPDYETAGQFQAASLSPSPFYSTAAHLPDQHEPTTSVWRPSVDSARWKSSGSSLNLGHEAFPSTTSSFAFRGPTPEPYYGPL